MARKKTNEQFLDELTLKRGNTYTPLEDYKGNQTKIRIKHNICGNTLDIRPKDLLVNNVNCAYCASNKKLTFEEVTDYIHLNSECKVLSNRNSFSNSTSKIKLLCSCGDEFQTTFLSFKHKNKHQCSLCSRKNVGLSKRNEYTFVKETIESVQGYALLSTNYNGNKEKLLIKCDRGHTYEQSFNDFVGGHKCKHCQYENNAEMFRWEYEYVKDYIENENYSLVTLEYKKCTDKLEMICNKGHSFSMTFDSFKNGNRRCPICNFSNGEKRIERFFLENQLKYIPQYKFDDCRNILPLPFDFAVFNSMNQLVCLIEFDGEQHFRPVDYFGGKSSFESLKIRDSIKNKYCVDKNIPLLRIPHWDIDNIETLLNDFILVTV